MDPSLMLVASVYGIVVLLWIFGGLFLRKISDRQLGFSHPFKQTWKIFFSWILPPWRRAVKILAVIALITAGIVTIASSLTWEYNEQVTGYRYVLVGGLNERAIVTMDGALTGYVWIPTYGLLEFPVKTGFYTTYINGFNLLTGITLILLGLYLGAYWLVKANNQLYGAK